MTLCATSLDCSWLAALVGASATSCGDVVRTGRAPVFLVIDSLQAARRRRRRRRSASTLLSDVITNVTTPAPCTTDSAVPDDLQRSRAGDAAARRSRTSAGGARRRRPTTRSRSPAITSPTAAPTAGTRRASTCRSRSTAPPPARCRRRHGDAGFELVRHVAKEESPLVQLKTNGRSSSRRLPR